MNFIGIIPARFASTRFPGKPLADIFGKPMIQHVYERALRVFDSVFVATDNDKIAKAVAAFGGHSVMTSSHHTSGTDRIAEAIEIIHTGGGKKFDVIINIQGDEPFIHTEQLELLKNCFLSAPETKIATLVKPIKNHEDIFNPNLPKVVVSSQQTALYFSRSPIPYIRGTETHLWGGVHTFYKHIGIYGYTFQTLKKITQMPPSALETAESLEQLRWLEAGLQIRVAVTELETIAVDTPEDLEKILK